MGKLMSVNLGVPRAVPWAGESGVSGIDRRPAPGRVRAHALGLEGDQVGDVRHHGGIDQAVYAYAREDARWWAAELSREVADGNFGENLSTEGVDITGAVIGEHWAIGTSVLEVSFPRIPCSVFAGFWGVPDLVMRFTARGAPGAYLRVITEGELGAGDDVEILHRPDRGVTIGETFLAFTTQPELLAKMVDAPGLPERHRETARRRVGATGAV